MDATLRAEVRQRAQYRCEYCFLPERLVLLEHEVDHVVAEQHGGPTVSENLALACVDCNRHKGPNLSGIDPDSGNLARLFNPRSDRWNEHFSWNGATLVGTTAAGRATVRVLASNLPHRVHMRRALMEEGVYFTQFSGA